MRLGTEAPIARVAAAAVSIVVAGILAWTPLGDGLGRLSYDLLQPFSRGTDLSRIVIVGVQPELPRTNYTAIFEKLAADKAALVVADVFFDTRKDPEEDGRLASAMLQHGRVVLAGDYEPLAPGSGVQGGTLQPPAEPFLSHALGWGLGRLLPDPDGVVRRHYAGTEERPSLPWAAAEALGAPVAGGASIRLSSRRWWLRYYGPPYTFAAVPGAEVAHHPPGFFRDRIVFLGAWPAGGMEVDTCRTPYTRLDGRLAPKVEVLATTLVNLMADDWLARSSVGGEWILFSCSALYLAWIATQSRRLHRWIGTLVGAAIVVLLALSLIWLGRIWIPWIVVLVSQGAAVLAAAFLLRTSSPSHSRGTVGGGDVMPRIPDHTLHRRIGQGGYGEVWHATGVVGLSRAVKIVRRDRFDHTEPYEREFRGIQAFLPVSLEHPGLLHILHVGRDDSAGWFFYIMEAGDDEVTGTMIDPRRYVPKTLAREIARRGKFPPAECLALMKELTSAVGFLHRKHLVHRDIKPANVIYVRGHPKLADVGLVSGIGKGGRDRSLVGTEGYLLPGSHGTEAADLYALGKLLYVALTGLGPMRFPELPDDPPSEGDRGALLFLELNEVAWKACGLDSDHSYASADAMMDALAALKTD